MYIRAASLVEFQVRTAKIKGQLILKANFKDFFWTKKPTKIFLYFSPTSFKQLLKSGQNKR